MKVISLIEDEQLVKMAAGGSNKNRLHQRMWYIRLWRSPLTEIFIINDESPSTSADDPASLLILRCSGDIFLLMLRPTGYPIDADYPIET